MKPIRKFRRLPTDAESRARARAIAQTIACDIPSPQQPRVLGYLTKNLGISEDQESDWYRHWVNEGLAATTSSSEAFHDFRGIAPG